LLLQIFKEIASEKQSFSNVMTFTSLFGNIEYLLNIKTFSTFGVLLKSSKLIKMQLTGMRNIF
jgi:hypothetical protein